MNLKKVVESVLLEYNNELEHYWPKDASNEGISFLALYLVSDVGCKGSIENWKEFFNDPKATWTGSNYSDWEKDGNHLSLGFSGDVDETEPRWETTSEQMNYILDRWQEACEKKPNKIIITRDGSGKVAVDFED